MIDQFRIFLLVTEVRANGSLEACGTFADNIAQILQIVTCCDAKLADKVLGSRLQIAVFLLGFILWSTKVCVR